MRKHVFLSMIVLLSSFTHLTLALDSAQVIDLAIKESQRRFGTPMKISYDVETTVFYQDYDVINKRPDGRIELETKGNVSGQHVTAEFSKEFQLPYAKGNQKIVLFFGGRRCSRFEQYREQDERPTVVEAFDGKETKVYMENKYTSMDGKKERIVKRGYPYKNYFSRFYRYYPFEVWCGLPIGDTVVDLKETKGMYHLSRGGSEKIISPADQYMTLWSRDVGEFSAEETTVTKTIRVSDFIMPEEILVRKYKGAGLRPDIFFVYKNISYTFLTPDELSKACKFDFPPGTKIQEIFPERQVGPVPINPPTKIKAGETR